MKFNHRFGRTDTGHSMVIIKVRPARELDETMLNECLMHIIGADHGRSGSGEIRKQTMVWGQHGGQHEGGRNGL